MDAIKFVLSWLVIGFLVGCVASFCVMMGVAELHEWWNVIPTMGFWQAFGPTVWFAVPLVIYTGYHNSSD
jgi:hypothetical protein